MRISDWSSDVCSSDLQTVVEYAPSGGWYTEILAPLLHEKGTFYALQPTGRSLDGYKAFLAAKPDVYGKVKVVPFPDQTGLIPAGSVDTLLTFRNVHNMVMGGTEAATFKAFYDLLNPGGTRGIVDHRLPEGRDTRGGRPHQRGGRTSVKEQRG